MTLKPLVLLSCLSGSVRMAGLGRQKKTTKGQRPFCGGLQWPRAMVGFGFVAEFRVLRRQRLNRTMLVTSCVCALVGSLGYTAHRILYQDPRRRLPVTSVSKPSKAQAGPLNMTKQTDGAPRLPQLRTRAQGFARAFLLVFSMPSLFGFRESGHVQFLRPAS